MKTTANTPNATVKKKTAPAKKISSGDKSLDDAILKFFPIKKKD